MKDVIEPSSKVVFRTELPNRLVVITERTLSEPDDLFRQYETYSSYVSDLESQARSNQFLTDYLSSARDAHVKLEKEWLDRPGPVPVLEALINARALIEANWSRKQGLYLGESLAPKYEAAILYKAAILGESVVSISDGYSV